MSAPPIARPPAAVVHFLSTLRLPPGVGEAALFAAQEEAMRAEPWPVVGELRKRVAVGPGLDADVVLPPAGAGWPVLVYVHGGGWEGGSPGTHRRVACELAARGFATVVPRYRLAPAHRHPAQLDDLDLTIAWAQAELASDGADPARLALAGDSAGAHLAAAAAVRRRLRGSDDVGAAIFLTPIFDYHESLPLVGPHGHDDRTQPLLEPRRFEQLRGDPAVNPLLAAAAFPPSFIGAGSEDPLAAQSRRAFAALRAAAVPVELDPGEGLPHLWYLLPGLPQAAAGLDRAAGWAKERL